VVEILFRLPSGTRVGRRFRQQQQVSALRDFVRAQGPELLDAAFTLVADFPRRTFQDPTQTLQAAGLADRTLLTVTRPAA
jgi:hypothetical protein